MSLQVYFNDTLIDEKYYTGLTNNNELFNESFKLGATACNQYKLKIAKEGVVNQPTIISLRDNGIEFARVTVDNIEEQDYEYVYTLTDKMVDLNFNYDASEIFVNGSTTLYNIVLDICTKVGLVLGTTNFRGYDKTINWYDNTRTARDYIGFIAELNGGYARIENNTLYFKKQKSSSAKTISIDDCENFNIGEYHKITRVVYELGALKYEYGDETGNTLYLNGDNVYITEQSEVEAIYNDIKNFEFYSFSTSNCPLDYDIKIGDVITFTDGSNNYPTIAQYDLEYFGGWIGGYNLDINTKKQEETKIIGDKQNIRNLKIIVDRQNNTITQVVEDVGEQNTKISEVQQTVNELNSKIQDIADITTFAETIYGSLNFTDINQSEPIEVKIYPTTKNISYLYPRSTVNTAQGLFPSSDQYMPNRILRFTNTETNEIFDYELPEDLLIITDTHNMYVGTKDEFYLGYDEQICQVTKRCTYNSSGTVSIMQSGGTPYEEIHTYPFPSIFLTDGNYIVQLLGYDNAYLGVRLMSQNIYTTQFATKAELSSTITQTANEIYLAVDEKLDEEDFTGANILLQINNDESLAQIQADKINLNGAITANGNTKINSDGSIELTNGKITSPYFNVAKNGKATIYCSNNTTDAFVVKIDENDSTKTYIQPAGIGLVGTNTDYRIDLQVERSGIERSAIDVTDHNGTTTIQGGGITTPVLTQTSLQEQKKNFEKLNSGLEIIKNIDVYKYNLKEEKDEYKKHIGFIIGNDFKYDKNVTSNQNNSVDIYSFISVCCKAIQEQQGEIEQLQKEIKKMKGEKNEQD